MDELPEAVDIGTRLYLARKRKRLTQIELADALETTPQSVSRWEQGAISPTVQQLMRICRALDIDPVVVLRPVVV